MRRDGVDLPKWSLRKSVATRGTLEVLDVRDDGVSRTVKIARLTTGSGQTLRQEIIYEPHLIWMSAGRFTLAGFERVHTGDQVVNFAQSWLCDIEEEPA